MRKPFARVAKPAFDLAARLGHEVGRLRPAANGIEWVGYCVLCGRGLMVPASPAEGPPLGGASRLKCIKRVASGPQKQEATA